MPDGFTKYNKSLGIMAFILLLLANIINLIIFAAFLKEEINMNFSPGTLAEMGVILVFIIQFLAIPIILGAILYLSLELLHKSFDKFSITNLIMVILLPILIISTIILILY